MAACGTDQGSYKAIWSHFEGWQVFVALVNGRRGAGGARGEPDEEDLELKALALSLCITDGLICKHLKPINLISIKISTR